MEIVLCVTGSIAAVETIKLVREIRRHNVEVTCFMSEEACKIIHPNALEFASGNKVILELTGKIEHITYSKPDLILVAPATANTISKFAYKISDNHITSLLITAQGNNTPILIVPAMHDSMFNSIEDNINKLKNEKINFIQPRLDENKAKFPDKEVIILHLLKCLNKKQLLNKKILISLGSTYEPIDPLRGITNQSSGKMGLELAKESFIQGANVTLVVGNVAIEIPPVFNIIKTESTKKMDDKITEIIEEFDVFISTAAVSDFTPEYTEKHKISSFQRLDLSLKPTNKIINNIKKLNKNIFLIGFKAEYNVTEDDLIQASKEQIEVTKADIVVANDLSIKDAGFGSDNNQVILISDIIEKISLRSKTEIAKILCEKISSLN